MWRTVIVDDDAQVLAGLKAIIPWKSLNMCLVGEARDGSEGMKVICEKEPDLVITDIYMPVMDGLEMMQSLYSCHAFTGKCVILSGHSDFEYARKALRLRIDEYLSKPTSSDTIKEVLARVTEQLAQHHVEQQKQEELEDQLKSYEYLIERNWLRDAVIGESSQRGAFLPLQHTWKNKRHVVCVLAIHQRPSMTSNVTDWFLLRVASKNIVGEIAKNHQIELDWVDLYNEFSAVVIHDDQESDWDKLYIQLQDIAAEIVESVSRYLKLKVLIGIGEPCDTWRQLSTSTDVAMQALKEPAKHVAISGEETTAVTDHKKKEPSWYYLSMAEAIRFGRSDEVESLLHQCFDQLELEGRLNSPDQLRMCGTEIWTAISYSMHHKGMPIDDIFSTIDLAEDLNRILFQEELRDWLIRRIIRIFDYYKLDDNIKHRRAIKRTIEYIHNHYQNDLSIQSIADDLNLSRNYLGQLFIKIVGESFKSYATRVRLEKARQLLVEGDELLVYEVAESVGYTHVPYFTRQFKQYFGCSPTMLLKESKTK
ncbi:response regulator [Alkalicoccobacillus gibsonii]|uniref:response regulator n=1 Tax=Alkalicoccobacillus gibsonii TaxID=79881 RepID=UPI001931E0BB|nr:response regulator [Alkalicoccobacillus gibsonii]MBM0066921.1 response regulator [Alkalicoccobacillus gibsonii]